jgi:hypothetical protein
VTAAAEQERLAREAELRAQLAAEERLTARALAASRISRQGADPRPHRVGLIRPPSATAGNQLRGAGDRCQAVK